MCPRTSHEGHASAVDTVIGVPPTHVHVAAGQSQLIEKSISPHVYACVAEQLPLLLVVPEPMPSLQLG
jgi:hypothetical protein